MILYNRIKIFKELYLFETGYKCEKIKIKKDGVYVFIDLDNLDNHWFKDYIISESYSMIKFKIDILFCDIIENFEEYVKSKKAISKFNL